MMKSSSLEEEKTNMRQHNWKCHESFGQEKENETIKNRIIRDIRNLFEHKEEDF